VAHALPAADGTIALTALGATAEIASTAGINRVPIASLFLSPGKSALVKGSEIIVGFYIPMLTSFLKSTEAALDENARSRSLQDASCFKRIMRPQGVALPILNCAAWLVRETDTIRAIHIAIGPGGGTPFRATAAEDTLCDQPLTELTFSHALELILEHVQFRSSARRASADYRRQIVGDLFKDVLNTAWNRAKSAQ
jgi:carbon-monoxide dehydrogenase medium subunit